MFYIKPGYFDTFTPNNDFSLFYILSHSFILFLYLYYPSIFPQYKRCCFYPVDNKKFIYGPGEKEKNDSFLYGNIYNYISPTAYKVLYKSPSLYILCQLLLYIMSSDIFLLSPGEKQHFCA